MDKVRRTAGEYLRLYGDPVKLPGRLADMHFGRSTGSSFLSSTSRQSPVSAGLQQARRLSVSTLVLATSTAASAQA